jgi:hypothetical protein
VRCFAANRPIVPSAGFGTKANGAIYACAIAVFMLVAVFCTRYLANGNPYGGFLFGVTIPEGARLVEPVKRRASKDDGTVDDFWSEAGAAHRPSRLRRWFDTYCG